MINFVRKVSYLLFAHIILTLILLRVKKAVVRELRIECYPGRWLGWSQLTCLHQPRFITLSPLPLAPVTSELAHLS